MKKLIVIVPLLIFQNAMSMQWFKHLRAANAYHNGDLATAEHVLDNALTDDAHDYQAAYNRGKVAYAQQDFKKAGAYFEKAAEVQNNDQLKMQAWFDNGNAQVQQKKLEAALESYEKVLEIAPEHQQAYEMVEQLKKLLEQQKKQQQQQQQNKQQDQQKNDQQQDNNDDNQQGDQNNADDQNGNKENKNNQNNDEHDQNDQNSDQKDQNQGNNDQSSNQNDLENKRKQKQEEQEGRDDENSKTQGQNRRQSNNQSQKDNNSQKSEQEKNHDQSSEQDEQPSSNDGTQNPQKKQGTDGTDAGQQMGEQSQGEPDKYGQLFAALDERDSQISKDMLKANLKEKMPHKYGQKNW